MAWSIAGNIKGATGSAGATGSQGPKGDTGDTGATGPQGNPTSVAAADGTITIGGTSSAVTVAVGTIAESKVTNLVADLAAKIPASTVDAKGDLLAGTADNTVARLAVGSDGQRLVADSTATPGVKWTDGVAALTDAATIATDASTGEVFTVTLGGNRTLGVPTNARDGMRRTWRFRQDATGGRTITLATGTGGFVLGSQIANTTLTGTANRVGYLTAMYDSGYTGGARWHVLAFEPLV
jgi:hypothetical protein